jgi:hypothetical protein
LATLVTPTANVPKNSKVGEENPEIVGTVMRLLQTKSLGDNS